MSRLFVLGLVLVAVLALAEARLDLGLCSANKPCQNPKAYCHYPDGTCGQGTGVCEYRAEICTMEHRPVCGCDGQTYSNPCMAGSAGVSLLTLQGCNVAVVSSCLADEDCADSNFCKREVGKCGGSGACAAVPSTCAMVHDPVCGCDGLTYTNPCAADANGVSVSALGECITASERTAPTCGNDADCPANQFCRFNTGDCQGTGSCSGKPELCPMLFDPVCGCDGKTYSNSCSARQRGASLSATGAC